MSSTENRRVEYRVQDGLAVIALSIRPATAYRRDLQTGLALERESQQPLFRSADAREGIAAYVEKRKPAFQGK